MVTLIADANFEEAVPDAGIEEEDPLLIEEDRAFLVAGFARSQTPEIYDVELESPRDYTSAVRGAGVRFGLASAASGAGAEAASSSAAAAAEEPEMGSGGAAAAAPEPRRQRRGVKRTRFVPEAVGRGVETMKKLTRDEIQDFILPNLAKKVRRRDPP